MMAVPFKLPVVALGALLGAGFLGGASAGHAGLRTTAYYAAWMQGTMPASQVDFGALTHVIHFAVVPDTDGTLDSEINVVTPANSADVVARAHAAGTKVLISVGGAGSAAGFRSACAPDTLPQFIDNLVSFARSRGYDGVDIDWEPLAATDAGLFSNFVNGLRTALDAESPRPLLTTAVAEQPELLASLQHRFDQIHLMTYDLAGPWPGWVTWFNAPLHDGGHRFPSTGELVPSTDGMLDRFLAAGVAAPKLAIGIDFYGRIWRGGAGTSTGGASLPRQSWTTAPVMSSASYAAIMAQHFQLGRHHWDAAAHAAYLSIDHPGSADDLFISYDDPTACRAKVQYALRRGLGGVMIWELGGGYRAEQPAGEREPLLQAVKAAVRDTFRITGMRIEGDDVVLTFRTAIGQTYRVEWSSDLAAESWQTLADLVATDSSSEVADHGAGGRPAGRFYRVIEIPGTGL